MVRRWGPEGRLSGLLLCVVLSAAALAGCLRAPVYRPPAGGSQMLGGQFEYPEAGEGTAGVVESSEDRPSLSVVTLEDARAREQREALSSWLAEHDGYTGEAVTRDRAYGRPIPEMASDLLAEALRRSGRFSEVRRVSRSAAASTDLVLTGRIRRLRGWQAYRVEDGRTRVLESMGDVFLDDVRVSDHRTGDLVFVGQTGAMLEHLPQRVDPYMVVEMAFHEAVAELARIIADSSLAQTVRPEVAIAATSGCPQSLLSDLPDGWEGDAGSDETPPGWNGEPSCASFSLTDRTRSYYHPRLGFYSPSLKMWMCEPDYEATMVLSAEASERFPATVIGLTADGGAVLVRTLGKSSWPRAPEQIADYLGLARPPSEPIFVIPAPDPKPLEGTGRSPKQRRSFTP